MNLIKTNLKKTLARTMYNVAVKNANTTSCIIAHQPIVPTDLKKLSKIK
ncbi:cyclic lactone autoinducer peptide [Sedimentibacter acidaminivorans]|uniref:Cyclic lactone autoinducer peptide n=1 Tax=Sedimentibacter acidaminivorans TaxID=913099 RepID=A0ABS4GCR0_9FIRM|nr:cyclic lactone autoinducer peptide [Sedimentibacter acidaminivorans]MBP1925461.1 cyclic lactone autoinducer peptide [Sedimentibacter acidaminivorans]